MQKTVLILGAGTSVDYGYPLWDKLKAKMRDFDVTKELSSIGLDSEQLKLHVEAHTEFLVFLYKYSDYTLSGDAVTQIGFTKNAG